MSEVILRAEAVSKRFAGSGSGGGDSAGVVALDAVSVEVRASAGLGIVGESGAGKSTLLNLLLGLDQPDSGRVMFRDEPLDMRNRARMRALRREVQVVFQDPRESLDPKMRVGAVVAEPLAALKILGDTKQRVQECLESVGLEADAASRYPHEFSGGQRQRIAIARALAPRPRVLVGDEPVSALDMSTRMHIIELLADLREKFGLTMLMVSHDLATVAHLCSEVLVLRNGLAEEAGDTMSVFAAPNSAYTRRLLSSIPTLPSASGGASP